MGGEPEVPTEDDGTVVTDPGRRKAVSLLIGGGLAAAAGAAARPGAAVAAETAKEPPRQGDALVFATGERKGQPVTAADLTPDNPMALTWPKDASSGVVKDKNRLNRVLVLKIDHASLDEKTRERAAEGGIVAYSAFCTHAGCTIEQYKTAENQIFCHCHFSAFDPRAGGRVVSGPAKRSLAGLPVALEGDGKIVVAGEFVGKLGIATG